ncbi:MAG: ribosome maturation factor RimP [Clostridia bacterium]|nr:ribosome maturation factor RimP [Clostridia bacterium]
MGVKIEHSVEEKIEPIVKELDFDIEYVEYVNEGGNNILRIVLDKSNGTIDVDECEKVSRAVENTVDTLIKNEYVLEVSSPGIERQLKNIRLYKKYTSQEIFVKLYQKTEYGKEITGILTNVNENDNTITVSINGKDIVLKLEEITSAHTVYDFSKDLKDAKPVNLNKLNKFNKK